MKETRLCAPAENNSKKKPADINYILSALLFALLRWIVHTTPKTMKNAKMLSRAACQSVFNSLAKIMPTLQLSLYSPAGLVIVIKITKIKNNFSSCFLPPFILWCVSRLSKLLLRSSVVACAMTQYIFPETFFLFFFFFYYVLWSPCAVAWY